MAGKNTAKSYLFDVDGVLTNPVAKSVSPEIIQALANLLSQGNPVTLNTGRSISWLLGPVVGPLMNHLGDHVLLERLFIIGEKGACWIHGRDLPKDSASLSAAKIEIDPNVSVSVDLQNDIRALAAEKYADTMFYDESKLTMVTVEMNDGEDLEKFELRQQELVKDLLAILERYQANNLKIDPTRIATDIEDNQVGKALGARRMLELMQAEGLETSHFEYLCFGDSRSDLEMASELHKQGLLVQFIFVGKPGQFRDDEIKALAFKFHQAGQLYDAGTLEYFASHS